jgi:hypothetical protein
MPPRILSIYPARSIYIARSNRVIDNRQDFIPNNKWEGSQEEEEEENAN